MRAICDIVLHQLSVHYSTYRAVLLQHVDVFHHVQLMLYSILLSVPCCLVFRVISLDSVRIIFYSIPFYPVRCFVLKRDAFYHGWFRLFVYTV